MPPSLTAALERRIETQSRERELVGESWEDSDLVFTTALGTPSTHGTTTAPARRSRRERACDASGYTTSATPRRGSCSPNHRPLTGAADQVGVPARVVMEILGHSQISITLNTYTHVDPELNRAATHLMEQALWPRA